MPRSTIAKIKRVFKLYLKNWINGPCNRDIYIAYDITKNRTNNHPEVYHSRQRLIYDKYRMPLGEWLIQFREMTNSEDNEVNAIRLYLKDPPIIDVDTLQIDARIAHYKEKLDQ
uniref:Uncharacterized protein n=1 Tax=Panagrolaimus davidi TaxID=227884 RepID=A0A914QMW7_9BILA